MTAIAYTDVRKVSQRRVYTLLDAVGETGAGTPHRVLNNCRVFQVIISDTATCLLQASLDGDNWVTLRTSTASEAYSTAEPWTYIRGNVSVWSAGTVTLLMGV